jgi:ribosomal-protein-alanine N-acetyltransferase
MVEASIGIAPGQWRRSVTARRVVAERRKESGDLVARRLPIRLISRKDRWVMGDVLHTPRLVMVPITLSLVEAMLAGRREEAERSIDARLPDTWPGPALVERAFCADVEAIRANPEFRLWGDRVMITTTNGPRRVVGSVVFHGGPDSDGVVEVGYGVEQESQRQGYATEGTRASVEWALSQPNVRAVRACTPSWHVASRRVLERCGMLLAGSHDHDMLGELLEYERRAVTQTMVDGFAGLRAAR